MNIHYYETSGGKNVILEYINSLPKNERAESLIMFKDIEEHGLNALDNLETRQIHKKIWEIKTAFSDRYYYIVVDNNNLYVLHACKKQKRKAEKIDVEKSKRRAKELEIILGKKLI